MIPNFQYPTPIDREVNWDKSKTIMSRTDAAGVIDYVNQGVLWRMRLLNRRTLRLSSQYYPPSRYAKGDLQSALG